MAQRAATAGIQPWDAGCGVSTLIGGFAAMNEMRDALESVIAAGHASAARPGSRGHVYFAGWRFNCQRDLSSLNMWGTRPWRSSNHDIATVDQTALGLMLRLMQAGIAVRILVWLPTPVQSGAASLEPHIADHVYLSDVVALENKRLDQLLNPTQQLGIVGLDGRTADGAIAGSHHQKMMVIRSPSVNVAFCGGVDLAFTRRDAPLNVVNHVPGAVHDGDWQSGTMPDLSPLFSPGINWPGDGNLANYASAARVKPPSALQPADLPIDTNAQDVCTAIGGAWNDTTKTCAYKTGGGATATQGTIYGLGLQLWHDQHLKLEGPIVASLEWQFAERWIDSWPFLSLLGFIDPGRGWATFSTPAAYDVSTSPITIRPLETPVDIPPIPGSTTVVQMWRTIPMRNSRITPLFQDGEFTIMAGFAKAMSTASELIWIFDQYFWSEPTARLLNQQLRAKPSLCVIIVLPPHADSTYGQIHQARKLALGELVLGLSADQRSRVAIYNMWRAAGGSKAAGRGIYVHAKAHTYDGALLVCGSANVNRRSLTCDSEIACGVVDADLVGDHQKRLWSMLFGGVQGAVGAWPNLDLNIAGEGRRFLSSFQAAALSEDACLVPDPWDDFNPANPNPKAVALPNGVPRTPAIQGPKYEIYYGFALDPGSLDPIVENDIVDAVLLPRPIRLDDIVYNIEQVYEKTAPRPRYTMRRQASLVRGSTLRYPGVVYFDAGYHYTETAAWFKQVCEGFPCFFVIGWPDYETQIYETVIDGQPVVLQLWKGWCQRFLGLEGFPGGVGAEVGVYRRIPGRLKVFLDQLGDMDAWSKRCKMFPEGYVEKLHTLADDHVWWPYPELGAKVDWALRHNTTAAPFFVSKPESTFWNCKWMTPEDYSDKYRADPSHEAPPIESVWDYALEFRVKGKQNEYSNLWERGGFPRP